MGSDDAVTTKWRELQPKTINRVVTTLAQHGLKLRTTNFLAATIRGGRFFFISRDRLTLDAHPGNPETGRPHAFPAPAGYLGDGRRPHRARAVEPQGPLQPTAAPAEVAAKEVEKSVSPVGSLPQ